MSSPTLLVDPFAASGMEYALALFDSAMPTNEDLQPTDENWELQLECLDIPGSFTQGQDPTVGALPADNVVMPAQGQQDNMSFNNQVPFPQVPQVAPATQAQQVQQVAPLQNTGFQQTQQPFNSQQIQQGRVQQGVIQQENVQAMRDIVAPPMGPAFSLNPNTDMVARQPMGHSVGNGAALPAAAPNAVQQGFTGGSVPMNLGLSSGSSSTSSSSGMSNTPPNDVSNQPLPQAFQRPLVTNNDNTGIQQPIKKSPFELLQTFHARNVPSNAMPHTLIESFDSLSNGLPSNFSENTEQNRQHGLYKFFHSGVPPAFTAITNNPVATMLNNAAAVAESTRKAAVFSTLRCVLMELVASGTIAGHRMHDLMSSNGEMRMALAEQIEANLLNAHSIDATEDIYSAYAATSAFFGSHPEILEHMLERCRHLDEEEKNSTIALINGNPVLALMEQRQIHLQTQSQPIQPPQAMMATQGTLQQSQLGQYLQSGQAGQPGQPMHQVQPVQPIQAVQPMQQLQSGQSMQPGQPMQQLHSGQQLQSGQPFWPGQRLQPGQPGQPSQQLQPGQPIQQLQPGQQFQTSQQFYSQQPMQQSQPGQQQQRQLAPAIAHAPSTGMANGVPAEEAPVLSRQSMGSQGPAAERGEAPKTNKRRRSPEEPEEAKATKKARSRKKSAQEAASGQAPITGAAGPAEEPKAT